jgi:hypothetical protein
VTFVTIVVGNLVIALFGARFGLPLLTGALGGSVLWSIAAVWVTLSEGFVWSDNEWIEDPLAVASVGALAGLVCGGYARMKMRHRQVHANLRRSIVYCVALSAIFFGWKFERARRQCEFVAFVVKSRGQAIYDYEATSKGPVGPEWLRG